MGEFRPKQMADDLCRILALGIDVVSVSNASLVYPPAADPRLVTRLEAAALQGGATLLTTGIDPGWSGDVLPLLLTGLCERVDTITVSEVMDYSSYPDAELTGWAFGFGRRPEEDIPLFMPGAATATWSGPIQLVADALGVELDGFEEELEHRLAPETFETAMGTMAEGTIAAVRFAVHGMRGGRAVITAVHCNRMRADLAPEWPVLTNGKQDGYLIEVVGSPSVTCQIELADDHGDNNGGGIIGTAMRAINAIPAVLQAPPGLVTPLDLPTICARGLVS
jgi:4-hydroxy-tetrahydrodipicolinate reductase